MRRIPVKHNCVELCPFYSLFSIFLHLPYPYTPTLFVLYNFALCSLILAVLLSHTLKKHAIIKHFFKHFIERFTGYLISSSSIRSLIPPIIFSVSLHLPTPPQYTFSYCHSGTAHTKNPHTHTYPITFPQSLPVFLPASSRPSPFPLSPPLPLLPFVSRPLFTLPTTLSTPIAPKHIAKNHISPLHPHLSPNRQLHAACVAPDIRKITSARTVLLARDPSRSPSTPRVNAPAWLEYAAVAI